ncbi:MAG: branched chain amino acid aminotransferase [Isosphaeraceae bacterium]
MRSWGNRSDTAVCDEPLYAHYLARTHLDHPGAGEVIAHHETDWRKVVDTLTTSVPAEKAIFYQKHMTHHLLPEIEREWIGLLKNAFLIRNPREVIHSLVKVLPDPSVEATGLPQQVEIFEWVRARTGSIPPVIDARDVLEDPRRELARLCESLEVPFSERMLSWPPGRRDTDGIWAKYWYENVEKTKGFQPYSPQDEPVPARFRGLLERCQEFYDHLHAHRLGRPSRPGSSEEASCSSSTTSETATS